ncbi:hypothetical protein ES708_29866 [subsurface metagenome]
MKINEFQLKFILDQKYSLKLRSFIEINVIAEIKEFIENFLEKDLSERKNAEFYEFKDQFEEYISGGEFSESETIQFSIGEKIEICQLADDTGFFRFEFSNISYADLPNMIIRDCCYALRYLVNEEAYDLVRELEKFMKKTEFKLWEIIDKTYSSLKVNKKDSELKVR